jgi:hypothetical protein
MNEQERQGLKQLLQQCIDKADLSNVQDHNVQDHEEDDYDLLTALDTERPDGAKLCPPELKGITC